MPNTQRWTELCDAMRRDGPPNDGMRTKKGKKQTQKKKRSECEKEMGNEMQKKQREAI